MTTAVSVMPPDAHVEAAPSSGRPESDDAWWGTQWKDEQGVIAAIRLGDVAAYEAFFRAHYQLMCEFAYRLVRRTDTAEEVVQEVLMDLWTRRATVTVRSSIRSYLYGAVRHNALDTLARGKRQAEHERAVYHFPAHAATQSDAHEQMVLAEQLAAIARVIETLPERRRTAFELRVSCQLSYAEIADVLDTTTKNVEVLIYRATVALRAALPHFMH